MWKWRMRKNRSETLCVIDAHFFFFLSGPRNVGDPYLHDTHDNGERPFRQVRSVTFV